MLERTETVGTARSWLDEFWAQGHLGRRDRIALNANFFFLFEESPLGQVERAAGLIAARSTAHHADLLAERGPAGAVAGPAAVDGAGPVRVLGDAHPAARTGRRLRSLSRYETARHVLVLHRGCLTRLDVVRPGGSPHTLAEELAACLRAVLASSAAAPGEGSE